MAHGHFELNTFVSTALEAAYNEGDAWLDELQQYLSKNMDYVIAQLTTILALKSINHKLLILYGLTIVRQDWKNRNHGSPADNR